MKPIRALRLRTAVPFAGALDNYTTNLWCASSIQRLLASYTGAALRVRRSSDNAEQDIGFSGTALDTASLAAFVGSNSAYVTVWYDQSGNGNHHSNSDTTKQPRIVNAGTYDGAIVFNVTGVADYLRSDNNFVSTASMSIFRRMRARSLNAFGFPYEYGAGDLIGSASGASQVRFNDGTVDLGLEMATDSGTAYSKAAFTGGTEQSASYLSSAHFITRGSSPPYLGMSAYHGSSGLSQSGSANVGSPSNSGNFPQYKFRIANRSDLLYGALVNMQAWVVYSANRVADAVAINAAIV